MNMSIFFNVQAKTDVTIWKYIEIQFNESVFKSL